MTGWYSIEKEVVVAGIRSPGAQVRVCRLLDRDVKDVDIRGATYILAYRCESSDWLPNQELIFKGFNF